MFTTTDATTIVLTNPAKLGDGSFQFTFTGTPGAAFTVMAATDAALPINNWTALSAPTEISPGQFRFTDAQAPSNPRRFYRVRSP
jgi:hypothetical protein